MDVISGCIVTKDNKILLVQEGLKDCYGKWNLPAGKTENFESRYDVRLDNQLAPFLGVSGT